MVCSMTKNADLDACHGRREQVTIDGRTYNYVYRLTREYPYTLGCFAGQLLENTRRDLHNGLGEKRASRPRPR
jgi:hypothetical protein